MISAYLSGLAISIRCNILIIHFFKARADRQPAALLHCVLGIYSKVYQDLLYLPGISHHCQGHVRKLKIKLNTLSDNPGKHFLHAKDNFIDVNGHHFYNIFSAEDKQPSGKIRGPVGGNEHLIHIFLCRTAGFQRVRDHGAKAHDHIEDIIEIVRNPPGQRADGLHLLGVTELGFKPLVLGDVSANTTYAYGFVLSITQYRCVECVGDLPPVFGNYNCFNTGTSFFNPFRMALDTRSFSSSRNKSVTFFKEISPSV